MPVCTSCGADHATSARFCPRCGVPLGRTCPSCAAPVSADADFCDQCGSGLEVAGPVGAGSERKVVTVVFADLAGSTGLAERLDPEDTREVLGAYFDAMRHVVEDEGGVVEKFIGDAVVAVFGVPAAHEDDPARALRACRGMLRSLDTVNKDLAARFDVSLELRVGVNTGSVLASVEPAAGEALVTGDVVNVAARLQTAAERGEVLVAERTVRACRGFEFAGRRELELKGVTGPVLAHTLVGGSGTNARGLPGLHAPMVGRDGELGMLTSVAERVARERRPSLVTIFGEAGVGKSRLVREFLDRAASFEPTPLVVRGRCLPYGDGVTYWPLAEILKGEAGVVDSDAPATALARIRALVEGLMSDRSAEDADRAVAALAYTVGIDDPDHPLAETEPRVVRRLVHAAWRGFFSSLSARRPVIAVVEDIHWADAALLDLLDELAERTDGPAMFVCPSRPDLVAARPGWGGGRRNSLSVSLDPLDPEESEQLVRLLLSVDDLPASVHRRILERAEGNPFFLEEILRRLIDEQLVVREGERWRARPGVEEVLIPDTVQGVLAARIDLLDPGDKRVLQAAAVIGRVFWSDLVAQLLAATSPDGPTGSAGIDAVEESLTRLENRDLVQRRRAGTAMGDEEHAFTHILTRDVTYAGIPKRDRGQAHAVVAGLLAEQLGDRSAELAELLAHHYATAVAAGAAASPAEAERLRFSAYDWLLRASAAARSKYVLPKAQRLAQDALDLATDDRERLPAVIALARAYGADSRGDLAWRHFRHAARLADADPDVSHLVAADLMANACEYPLRWPGSMSYQPPAAQVRALLDRGLELVPGGDVRERARLLAARAGWPFAYPSELTEDELDGFRADGLEAADIALRLDDADLASGALDMACAADNSRGHYRPTLALWERRWALRDRLSDDLEVGDLYAMGAWIYWEVGDYERAEHYAGVIANSQELAGAVHARAWRVAALFRLGRWDEALLPFYDLRDRLDDRRDSPPYYASHAYAIAALVHRLRGERVEADRIATVVRGLSAGSVRAYGWRVFVLLSQGDFEEAVTAIESPPEAWEVHASVAWEARCDTALTGIVGATTAADTVEGALGYADAAESVSVTAFARRLAGAEAHARGDLDDARDLLARAASGFEELGMAWELARTRLLLGRTLRELGATAEAEDVEAAGRATLEALGVVEDPVLRAALAR